MKEFIIISSIDYIKEHLDEELTVERIAEQCHFSKYYFNRLFKSVVGESVYAFIKRLRIEKSAGDLARSTNTSITEISGIYGYSSSNYSTAFKNHYGQSPAAFKKKRSEEKIVQNDKGFYADLSDKTFEYYDKRLSLVILDDTEVIVKRFIGNYRNLARYWAEFFDLYGHYRDETSMEIEISYDDPILTDPDRCITDVCMTTSKVIDASCPTAIIKGGKYLKYPYSGKSAKIFELFQGLLCVWMKETTYDIDFDNRKLLMRYHSVDLEKGYFDFDIFIPVR